MKRLVSKKILLVLLVTVLCSSVWMVAAGGTTVSGDADSSKYDVFYRLSPELESEVQQVVLTDQRVQNALAKRDLDYKVNVGAILKEDVEYEAFLEWLRGGRKDTSVISEFVGVLSIGYNDSIDLDIDMDKKAVTSFKEHVKAGPRIPDVTREEKQQALAAIMADSRIQELLAGKNYTPATNAEIGVWHTSDMKKIGLAATIRFEEPYTIEYAWPDTEVSFDKDSKPTYQAKQERETYEAKSLMIMVDFTGENVVVIQPVGQLLETAKGEK